MSFTKNGKIFLLAFFSSLLFPFLSLTKSGFAFFGLGLSFIILTNLIYFVKKNKTAKTKLYYLFTLFFSTFIFVRSEGSITFLNILATLFFGSLMVKPNWGKNLFQTLVSPAFLIIKSFLTKNVYKLEYIKDSSTKIKPKVFEVMVGIAVSVLVLIIILPLLASANPFFNKILVDTINILNLNNLFNFFNIENIFINLVRLSISIFLIILLPKMMSASNNKSEEFGGFTLPFNLSIPKAVVGAVLILFFVTQLQLYFSTDETLTKMGYSLSSYTREVFGQLSVVSIIVFFLVYLDKSSSKLARLLNYVLLIQAGFLTLMAAKSVFEYSNKWGFTYKRLYGFSVVIWTLGTLGLFLQNIKNASLRFVPRLIVWSGLVLILINISNFDYLIYNFRKASTGQGIDYPYLSRLSNDSLSYMNQLDEIVKILPQEFDNREKTDRYLSLSTSGNMILYRIESLRKNYGKLDFRTFNLLNFISYQRVKDVDIESYRKLFTKFTPVYEYPLEYPVNSLPKELE